MITILLGRVRSLRRCYCECYFITNQWHGSAFEFFARCAKAAPLPTTVRRRVAEKPPIRRISWRHTGRPRMKDKTFFFVSTRLRQKEFETNTNPSVHELSGKEISQSFDSAGG